MANDRGELGESRGRRAEAHPSGRRRLTATARLVGLPSLFTAPPDVLLGAALVSGAGVAVSTRAVVGLALASVALYAGGTILGHAFDGGNDDGVSTERPIPVETVSRSVALLLGGGLLALGVGIAGGSSGGAGAVVAGAIALAIVAYDGWLANSSAGPLALGAARAMNVWLGVTAGFAATGVSPTALPGTGVVASFVIGAYVSAVTAMAAGETVGGTRRAIAVAGATVVGAVVTLGWILVWAGVDVLELVFALALAAVFAGWVGRAILRAYAEPVPGTIGSAVGTAVLGLILLDAAFAAAGGLVWALVAVAFLVPAVPLSRAFDAG